MNPGSGSDGGGVRDDGGNGGPAADSGGDLPLDAAPSGDAHTPSTDSGTPAAGDAAAGPGVYGNPGPDSVTTATFSVTSPNDTFTTTAYIPGGAGPFPVVILSSGFEQDGRGLRAVRQPARQLGHHHLPARRSGRAGEPHRDAARVGRGVHGDDLACRTRRRLLERAARQGRHAKSAWPDTRAAARRRCSRAKPPGKILGVFGLDPVDTATDNVEARTTLATIGARWRSSARRPTARVAWPACLRAGRRQLPRALRRRGVSRGRDHGRGADHTMFEDPAHCTFCTLCTAGTAKQPRCATRGALPHRVLRAELLGDTTVAPRSQGAGAGQDVAAGVIQLVSK